MSREERREARRTVMRFLDGALSGMGVAALVATLLLGPSLAPVLLAQTTGSGNAPVTSSQVPDPYTPPDGTWNVTGSIVITGDLQSGAGSVFRASSGVSVFGSAAGQDTSIGPNGNVIANRWTFSGASALLTMPAGASLTGTNDVTFGTSTATGRGILSGRNNTAQLICGAAATNCSLLSGNTFTFGGTSDPVKGIKMFDVTVDPASVTDSCTDNAVTTTGVVAKDGCSVFAPSLPATCWETCYIAAADTTTLRTCCHGTQNVVSQVFTFSTVLTH